MVSLDTEHVLHFELRKGQKALVAVEQRSEVANWRQIAIQPLNGSEGNCLFW